MQHTRRLTTGAVAVLTALMLMLPASAHGGRHHQAAAQTPVTNCGVCAVETCHTSGRHTHSGVTYCGYNHASGVCNGTCAALCAVEDCAVTGRHVHSKTTYCGYDHAGGFCDGACAALCAVSGCTAAGRHTHSGVTYCGYDHAVSATAHAPLFWLRRPPRLHPP